MKRTVSPTLSYSFYVPALSNAAGTAQWTEGDVFAGVLQSDYYWSSASLVHFPSAAWIVYLYDGDVSYVDKTYTYYVWPVRGGL